MKIDQNLLDRYKNGTCTKEELKWLKHYFQKGDYSELDIVLREEWENSLSKPSYNSEEVKQQVWQELQSKRTIIPKKEVGINRKLLRIAASITILLAAAAIFWLKDEVINNQFVETINEGTMPKQIALEDGTSVWLTPGSELQYPVPFEAHNRTVNLSGEARFEVAKDKSRPFIVQTEEVFTRVLGTTFNIEAFPNREIIEVVLLEGKVAVDIQQGTSILKAATLIPGEAFTFQKSNGVYTTTQLANTAVYGWKEGIIHFHRANIEEVVEALENWYSISIQIEDNSKTYESLVHRIDTRKMDLQQVLEGISLVANYRFKKTGPYEYLVVPK